MSYHVLYEDIGSADLYTLIDKHGFSTVSSFLLEAVRRLPKLQEVHNLTPFMELVKEGVLVGELSSPLHFEESDLPVLQTLLKEFCRLYAQLTEGLVDINSMITYGYVWHDMVPVTQNQAEELHALDVAVYVLYSDDTESLVEADSELADNDNLMFGVELESVWDRFSAEDMVTSSNFN